MKNRQLRNEMAQKLKSLRKKKAYVPVRQTHSTPVVLEHGEGCGLQLSSYSELTKSVILELFEGVSNNAWLNIEQCFDYDDYPNGIAVHVMNQAKQSDEEYYKDILDDWVTNCSEDKVLALRQRAVAAGVDLNYYQAKVLLEYAEEMNRKVIL